MVKSLIETYKTIKEATNVFRAQAAGLGAAPAAPASAAAPATKPLGGTSSLGSSSIVPKAQPSQQKIDSSRSLRNTTLQPGTNQTAKPVPMGGSVPGRQVTSTMMAAKSPTMQGRPAGAPTSPINVNRPVTSTGNPNAAGGIAPAKPRIFPQSNGPMGTQLGRVNRNAPTGQDAMTSAQKTRETARVADQKTAVANFANTPRGQSINARRGNDMNGPSSSAVRSTAPVRPAAAAPSTGAPQNRMDVVRQAQQQRKQDARISAVSRPGGTIPTQSSPRPGDKVPGEKVATNAQLTGQALARKGFGKDSGGGNYPSAIAAKKPEVDQSIGNPMGDYNPGQDNSVPTQSAGQKLADKVATATQPKAPVPKPKPVQGGTQKAVQQKQRVKPAAAAAPVARTKPKVGTTAPKIDREARRRVLAGKEGVGPAANKLRQRSGVKLGVKSGKVTNKQLSEMIKQIREKKLLEIIGKPGPFDPAHHTGTHGEDPQSPNQYVKKKIVDEARTPVTSGGAQGMSTLGGAGLKNRSQGQRSRGNQNIVGRSLNTSHLGEQDNVDLGSTDTGKKGKEAEVISVNPKDNTASAKGSMNKNITIKELKEK